MDSIIMALDANDNLTPDVKADIRNMLEILTQTFSLDTEYVANKLKVLDVVEAPRYGHYEDITINGNMVLLSLDGIKEKFGDSVCMQYVLKYLYPNKSIGLDALYSGTLEMISNSKVGNSNGTDEFIMCDLLSKIMEPDMSKPDPIMTSFFEGNIAKCLIKLEEKGISKEEIANLMNLANHNYMTTKFREKSNLATIERFLFNFKLRQNCSKEELEEFKESMSLKSKYYENASSQYIELDALDIECEEIVKNYSNAEKAIQR